MAREEFITIRLTRRERFALEALAITQGRTKAEILRLALDQFTAKCAPKSQPDDQRGEK